MYHEVQCVLIDFVHFLQRIKKVKEWEKLWGKGIL